MSPANRILTICSADALAMAGFFLAVPDIGAFLASAFAALFASATWPLLRRALVDLERDKRANERR